MNQELEALVRAYDAYLESRGEDALRASHQFELLLDQQLDRHPGLSRDLLRKSVIKAHRDWARQQLNKPPAIPPRD